MAEFLACVSGRYAADVDDCVLFYQRILCASEWPDGGSELRPSESGALSREKRHNDVDELYLYSVDKTKYIVAESNIRVSEIEAFMEVLRQGMQIDVLVAWDGVRELVADGEVLLSRETTAERAGRTAVLAIVVGSLMFIESAVMAVRTTALFIKKQKGWNFLTREVFSNPSIRAIMQNEI